MDENEDQQNEPFETYSAFTPTPKNVLNILKAGKRSLKHGIVVPGNGLNTTISVIVMYMGAIWDVRFVHDLVEDTFSNVIMAVNQINVDNSWSINVSAKGDIDIVDAKK